MPTLPLTIINRLLTISVLLGAPLKHVKFCLGIPLVPSSIFSLTDQYIIISLHAQPPRATAATNIALLAGFTGKVNASSGGLAGKNQSEP